MSFGLIVTSSHAADHDSRAGNGWTFLVTVLTLRFLLTSLPESIPAQGILGLVEGEVLTNGQVFRATAAVLLLWACLKTGGNLVRFARLLPS